MPSRIQRRRTKGWKMPPNCVSVTRPGKWGNPFPTAEQFEQVLRVCLDRGAVRLTLGELHHMLRIAEDIEELRGKDLACFCPLDRPCHADVLLEIANA